MISCYERLACILSPGDPATEFADSEFEWLIEGESSILQLLARLAYYAGCEPSLSDSDVPREEQTRIYQTVNAYRTARSNPPVATA
jgi:hypothetical protein